MQNPKDVNKTKLINIDNDDWKDANYDSNWWKIYGQHFSDDVIIDCIGTDTLSMASLYYCITIIMISIEIFFPSFTQRYFSHEPDVILIYS